MPSIAQVQRGLSSCGLAMLRNHSAFSDLGSQTLRLMTPSSSFATHSRPPSADETGTQWPARPRASRFKISSIGDLRKPVEYVPLEEHPAKQLPGIIHGLYDDIHKIAVLRNGFVPCRLRPALKKLAPSLGDLTFGGEDIKAGQVRATIDMVRDIKDEARLCASTWASESAWNSDVHSPLLKYALRPFPTLRQHIITTAGISQPFLSRMREGLYPEVVRSRMADYGITFEPDPSLRQAIQTKLAGLPSSERCINQTTYGPVQYLPLGVSIETKILSAGERDRPLQLAVWVAAWHERVLRLTDADKDDQPGMKGLPPAGIVSSLGIIPLPLIIILGHEWKLYFAVDRGCKIEIVQCVTIGSTVNIGDIFMIVAVLRRLATWVLGDFQEWFRGVLIPQGTPRKVVPSRRRG